jgi:hypothetical protein
LVQKNIEDPTRRTFTTAVFNPRGLFATGFLNDQHAFLEGSTKACGAAAPTSPPPGVTVHPH